MANQIDPDHARRYAIWVVKKLRDAGYEALWAGGCVRDELLGETPNDYDVATNARPEEVRHCFGRARTLAIGAAFGVITVRGRHDQGQIEVATFRNDAPYSDGRHPDHVSFSTAREDALRRDFTMNGLFYDPLADQVIDYVGGRDDLHAGVVRAIGDAYQRIAEDRLRMLRAVRFATTFGFRIDPHTEEAVRGEAMHITVVSAERIAAEMRKILVHANRSEGMRLMRDLQLLPVVLPEMSVLWEPTDSRDADGNLATWATSLDILHRLDQPTFRVALAALLWGIDTRDRTGKRVPEICARWKLSNHEQKGVRWLLAHQQTLRHASSVPWPILQRVLVAPDIGELLTLAAAIAVEVDSTLDQIDYCRAKLELPAEQLNPPPLITGNELCQSGLTAGPLFRRILREIRDAQLEGTVTNQEEALAMGMAIARQKEPDE